MAISISLGLLSGLFFSSTFVRKSLYEFGRWTLGWSASLRYAFMILFLLMVLRIVQGQKRQGKCLSSFLSIGFFGWYLGVLVLVVFYALICYSADYAPSWVVAATWQVTIIASFADFDCSFGRSFPKKYGYFH